jgi:hypothetical protein
MPDRPLLAVLGFLALAACGGEPKQISVGRMKAYEISVAASPDSMAMAWHSGRKGRDAIWLQWLNPDGRAKGSPVQVTNGQRDAWEPDLLLIGGDAVLAWYEKDPAAGNLTAWISRVSRDGRLLWRRQLDAAGGYARNPVVRLSGHALHVAWIETPKKDADGSPAAPPAVWAETLDETGGLVAGPRPVGEASVTTYNLNAAVDRRDAFFVVYDAKVGTQASELHLSTITDAEIQQRTISDDDGHASLYPDLAINGADEVGLAWFDEKDGNREVYLRTGALAQLTGGGPLKEQRITNTPAPSIGAYLAWNGHRLGLAWCDSDFGQSEVYIETFLPDGSAPSGARRLSFTPTQSSIPSIRPWRDGFVLGWNEYQTRGEGDGHVAVESSRAMLQQLQ